MPIQPVNPPSLMPPRGFSHAMKAQGNTVLYIAGQVAADSAGTIQHRGDLVGQFELTLSNIKTVVEEAGGTLANIVKLNIYVLDVDDYLSKLKPLGEVYRKYFGKHYPAMTLAEVKGLYNDGALIEIEGIAVLD
jgi:enamine deaminase RidA (YjgF/YER057c/UK114 family)